MAKPKKTPNLFYRDDVPWMDWTHREQETGRRIARYRLSLNLVSGEEIATKEHAVAVMEKTKHAIREGRFRGTLKASETTKEQDKGRTLIAVVIAEYKAQHNPRIAVTSNVDGAVNRLAARYPTLAIGDLDLDKLDFHVAELQKPEKFAAGHKTARTRSAGSVNEHVVRLSHFVKWCVQRKYLKTNPLIDETTGERLIKKVSGQTQRNVTYSADEQQAIIASARASCVSHAGDWLEFALDTGLRRGEQFGRWKRRPLGAFDDTSGIRVMDWNQFTSKLTVRAVVAKTRRDREIPIATERARRILQEACAPNGVARPPNALIFVTIDGTPIARTSPLARFKLACKAAGVRLKRGRPDAQWRDLRKTFATDLYYRLKVPLQVIQRLLGHTTIQMTMTYLNVTEAGIEMALTGFDAMRKTQDTSTTQEGQQVATNA